jgi:2-dehydro-3-deoxyphosphooctonate aldolase (KDO 8-P synthase)
MAMRIGDVVIGGGAPLVLISGLNVLESLGDTLEAAAAVQGVADRHGVPVVFKASFDKANRSSHQSYRGLGLDEGMRILRRVKHETGMAITTDVHEPGQAKIVAEVADCLQVPAFLSRQTDLIKACAATGRPMNIKRGQFVAPHDMVHAVEKAGTSFGYNDLIVDMRGLVTMRSFAPVCFDATHAVQFPGGSENASAGDSSYVAPLARAAAAVGIDALFVEIHADPDGAPCDGQCQLRAEQLDRLLGEVCAIGAAVVPGI